MDKSSHPPPYQAPDSNTQPPAGTTSVVITPSPVAGLGQPLAGLGQPLAGLRQPLAGLGHTVILGPTLHLGPVSQSVTCPHCHGLILTKVEPETTTKTHLIAVCLCAVGLFPCACLPYCMDSCKTKNHYCPNCGAFLGAYNN